MNERVIEIRNLVKTFGNFRAVDDLSLEVRAGEIFGLLGPNGAGKTTTIRVAMDILKPDRGEVRVLGQRPGEARERIGYLPEERGLYRNRRVLDTLTYLGELKGGDRKAIRRCAEEWLERADLGEWKRHKLRDLSRGMQQKVQIIASLVHGPALAILDEPFQGLDPLNVGSIKDIIRALREDGKTIVLCAHEMSLVEALCDRIALVHRGRVVLYGDLQAIKRQYAPNAVRLRTSVTPGDLPGVVRCERLGNDTYNLTLDETTDPQTLLGKLVQSAIPVESFEVATLPLEEVFIRVVRESADA